MLDFHNHLSPGVDDGAADLDESRAGLDLMRQQGVTSIITTPHIRASVTTSARELAAVMDALDHGWSALKALQEDEFPDLRLERGVEIMLDTPSLDLSDPRLRLAGTSFVLVEFPFMSIPPHSSSAIKSLADKGWRPVIAHPERYSNMTVNVELVDDWRHAGARLQVNSGSLLGYYGSTARKLSWQFLQKGVVDYLSSDYHSRGKCAVSEAAEALTRRNGAAQLDALTVTNPERLIRDQDPLPVLALKERPASLWKRLRFS